MMSRQFQPVELARLFVAPWTLSRVAMAVPLPLAGVVGSLSGSLAAAALLVGPSSGAGEPFRNLTHYARETLILMGWCALLLMIFALMIAWPMVVHAPRPDKEPHVRAQIGATLLAPTTIVLPALLWSAAAALAAAQSPNFDFTTMTKPAWLMTPVITVLGSCAWPPVLIIACALNAGRARRGLSSVLPEGRVCPHCLYDLSGLRVDAPCPECGEWGAA